MVSTCARNSFWILQKWQIEKPTHFTHMIYCIIFGSFHWECLSLDLHQCATTNHNSQSSILGAGNQEWSLSKHQTNNKQRVLSHWCLSWKTDHPVSWDGFPSFTSKWSQHLGPQPRMVPNYCNIVEPFGRLGKTPIDWELGRKTLLPLWGIHNQISETADFGLERFNPSQTYIYIKHVHPSRSSKAIWKKNIVQFS